LHLLTSNPDRNQQQRNNAETSLTAKHRGAIVWTSHRNAQSRRHSTAAARYFDTYRAAIVIAGDWEKVKDQVTPFGDVTMYDAEGKVIQD
jgi:hypothetical protein